MNHLEVFTGSGKVKKAKVVLDFNGAMNIAKTNKVRYQQRTFSL